MQQLDSIVQGVTFLRWYEKEEFAEEKVVATLNSLSGIRKTFRKGKSKREQERIGSLAAEPPELSGVAAFLENRKLSNIFENNFQKIQSCPESISSKVYQECLTIVAGRILYR